MEISTSRLRDHKWKIPVPDGPIYGEHVTPYSPDFNPMEMAFCKLKAVLHGKAERTVSALCDAFGATIPLFSPDECENYFAAAGYDQIKPDVF